METEAEATVHEDRYEHAPLSAAPEAAPQREREPEADAEPPAAEALLDLPEPAEALAAEAPVADAHAADAHAVEAPVAAELPVEPIEVEPAAVAAEPEAAPEPAREAPAPIARPRGEGRASRSSEWPVAWLRLVEAEPPAPAAEDEAVAAVLASEPADPHAFGLAMAAALDEIEPEPEPEAALDPEHEPEEPELSALELGDFEFDSEFAEDDLNIDGFRPAARKSAGGPVAANDSAPLVPVRLKSARPRPAPVPAEAAPAKAKDEPSQPEAETEPLFDARLAFDRSNFARRKQAARGESQPLEGKPGEGGLATMVYLLYLAGFLVAPAIAGVAIALNARREAPDWLESHYVFQIRTFWIGLVGAAISAALLLSGALTLVGLVMGLFLIVWLLGRSALGFINVVKLKSYPHPRAWLL